MQSVEASRAESGAERARLAGVSGCELLERYWQDGDGDTLAAAIERLGVAVDAGPDHPDHPRWLQHLGLAYGERAATSEDLADYDRAVALLRRAQEGLADPDERAFTAVAVAELSWDRFATVWSGPATDEATACAEAGRLGAGLATLSASDGLDTDTGLYVALMGGLALLVAFDAGGDPQDLRHGIAAVEAGLDTLAPDGPRWSFIGVQLASGYRSRAGLDGSVDDLGRAIATATATVAGTDLDRPEWMLAHVHLAFAYQARWTAVRQVADLDAAIVAWRHVVSRPDGPPQAAMSCGALLRARAGVAGNAGAAADLAEAVRLLEAALQDPRISEDGTTCLGWYELAQAHHASWELDNAAPSLDRAAHAVQRALRPDLLDVDDLLQVHLLRTTIGHALLQRDAGDPLRGQPARTRQRHELAAAQEALAAAHAADPAVRAHVAGHLATQLIGLAGHDGVTPADRIRALYDLAATHPDPPPGWPAVLDLISGSVTAEQDLQRLSAQPSTAVDDLARVAQYTRTMAWQPGSSGPATMQGLLATAAHAHATATGDVRGVQAADSALRAAVAATPPSGGGPFDPELTAVVGMLSALTNARGGNLADLGPALDDLGRVSDSLSRSAGGQAILHLQRLLQDMLVATGRIDPPVGARADLPAGAPTDPTGQAPDVTALAVRVATLIAQLDDAMRRDDRGLLRVTAGALADLIGQTPPDHVMRLNTSAVAAGAYLELARRDPADRAAARQAAHWFAEAGRIAGDERHPYWARMMLGQAESLRRAGTADRAHSRGLGHAALRGDAWQVIRQAGTDYAMAAADNAEHALTVAAWCAEDQALDELVAALDAGRGLVLAAAVSAQSIARQLVEHGHPELAAQWLDTAGLGRDRLTGALLGAGRTGEELSDDLRLRALTALRSDPRGRSLLDLLEPVRVDDVRADLHRLDLDALVYLLPPAAGGNGGAVVVPVAGPVQLLPLPRLVLDADSPVGRYLGTAADSRELGPAPGDGRDGTSLDALCEWAWTAAVGPLIEHTRRWNLRRAPRLAVVAMSVLGQVPWHAAYTYRDSVRRYAVEDLVISYCVSARLLRRPTRRTIHPNWSALVVGNPGGDLGFAGVEARSIQRRFYPTGTYFGQPAEAADGIGTPEQVLAWIAGAASGPSLLHFACHGRADPQHPADTHLELAGGERLAVRDLLEASRAAGLVINTVFLAACTTGRAGAAHDEALSLATAFLAAGAHTVFGTLWPVPDAATSLLMYMVHHYLNVSAAAPAEALRKAQLWMLDPARRPPDGMPPELAGQCSRPEAADPASWAGFTHYGA